MLEFEIIEEPALDFEISETVVVTESQSFANKEVLSKFSEDADGNLYYGSERLACLPSGGTEGQVLEKKSDKDYDYGWGDSVTLEYNAGSLKIF